MARKTSKTPIADPHSDSSSSSGQEDEDNEEEETLTRTQETQKNSTKPMTETSKTKKTGSKHLPSSTKRSNTSDAEPKESKRSKKKPDVEGSGSAAAAVVLEDVEKKKTGEEDEKKQLFQRLFSEDDEIVVLKGLLDYITQKRVDYPFVNTNAFHDFVKDLIHTDVSKQQLMYKVRRLKKKFENNIRRSKQGEDRIFTNPHEQKIFELSKMIWGKQGISGKLGNDSLYCSKPSLYAMEINVKEEVCGEAIEVEMELSKSLGSLFDVRYGVGGLENEILKHGFDVVEGEKKEALEEKWRKLQVAELELFVQRKELIIEQAKLMLEVYKSEDA